MPAHSLRLIVGLGNPGTEYAGTRHNVGFMIADRLAAGAQTAFRKERAFQADLARADDLFFCKPRTYMNLSGESVHSLASFYKIPPWEMLVVLDDMALPLGKLRLRENGSAGGHNGLQSIIQHLGPAIPRLRVGIGAAEPGAAIGHVLGRFAPEEREPLDQAMTRAVEAIRCLRENGMQAAMNGFN